MSKDVERLSRALEKLKDATDTETNSLGVNHQEYWFREAIWVVEKIRYRAIRLLSECKDGSAFGPELLVSIGEPNLALDVFFTRLELLMGDSLEDDLLTFRAFHKKLQCWPNTAAAARAKFIDLARLVYGKDFSSEELE